MPAPPSAPSPGARLGPTVLAPEHAATLSPEARRIARICGVMLGVMGAGSMLGVAFSLYLVNEQPLLLVALSPLGRHFVLAAPNVDPLALLAVGTVRRLAFYTTCFYLGRSLGPVGLIWLEARARHFARWVRWLERLFERAGHVVVLLFCGPTVSTLAGVGRMHLGVFLALATVSLVFRLIVLIAAAEWLREPLEQLLGVIEEYRLPGTLSLIAAILIYQVIRRRRLARA
jgi:membrane protein DedA with SNARE-associated domain